MLWYLACLVLIALPLAEYWGVRREDRANRTNAERVGLYGNLHSRFGLLAILAVSVANTWGGPFTWVVNTASLALLASLSEGIRIYLALGADARWRGTGTTQAWRARRSFLRAAPITVIVVMIALSSASSPIAEPWGQLAMLLGIILYVWALKRFQRTLTNLRVLQEPELLARFQELGARAGVEVRGADVVLDEGGAPTVTYIEGRIWVTQTALEHLNREDIVTLAAYSLVYHRAHWRHLGGAFLRIAGMLGLVGLVWGGVATLRPSLLPAALGLLPYVALALFLRAVLRSSRRWGQSVHRSAAALSSPAAYYLATARFYLLALNLKGQGPVQWNPIAAKSLAAVGTAVELAAERQAELFEQVKAEFERRAGFPRPDSALS